MKTIARFRLVPALLLLLVAALPAGGQAQDDEGESGGIPSWSVARLRVIDGPVWVLPPGESEWQEHDGNAPMPADTRIRVPSGSAADIRFDRGQVVRLREGTDIEIYRLSEERVSVLLHEGRASFRLPADDFFLPLNVVLPDASVVRFAEPGRYRVEADGKGGESRVRVFEGLARIKVGEGRYQVRGGEEATVSGGVSIGRLSETDSGIVEPAPPDLTAVERTVEAPPDVVYELRDYGDWVTVPSYGVVWRPRVAVGWSPYYYGRWVWFSSIGWSWVSVEPWGWYPYRCGNWIHDASFGWVWTPHRSFVSFTFQGGHRHFRPAWYYPSTVRFVRDDRGVRWIPLRPGERFVRPGISRDDGSLRRWYEPLKRETVFRRDPSRHDGPAQWRDSHVERRAERTLVKPPPVERPRRDLERRTGDADRSPGRPGIGRGTEERRNLRDGARPRPVPSGPGPNREIRRAPGAERPPGGGRIERVPDGGRIERPYRRGGEEDRPAVRTPGSPPAGRGGSFTAPAPRGDERPPARRVEPPGRPEASTPPRMIEPPRIPAPQRPPEPRRFETPERPSSPGRLPDRGPGFERPERGRGGEGGSDRGGDGGSGRGGGRDRR